MKGFKAQFNRALGGEFMGFLKRIIILCFAVFLYPIFLHAEWITIKPSENFLKPPPNFHLIRSDENSSVLEFDLPEFERDSIYVKDQKYSRISVPGLGWTDQESFPELPRLSKDIMIPASSDHLDLKVLQIKTKDFYLGKVLPSRGMILRNWNIDAIPFREEKFYQSSDFFPLHFVELGKTFVLRDVGGVQIHLFPFQYDSKSHRLRVVTHIKIELLTHRPKNFVHLFRMQEPLDSNFVSVYQNHFINFNAQWKKQKSVAAQTHEIEDNGKMLILSHPLFSDDLKDFIHWKEERGIEVKLVTLSAKQRTAEKIQELIQNEYNQNHISYVLLIGDAEFIPYHKGISGIALNKEADPLYALVDGNDEYPDLFVSRMSVKTPDELKNVLNKTIHYEKNPDPNGEWYSKSLGVASQEGGWSGMKDKDRMDVLRNLLLGWVYKQDDQIYEPNDHTDDLVRDINEGRGFINYIGHGDKSKWFTSNFTNDDIDSLENGYKLPFIVSVACLNGHFAYPGRDSFAEHWLNAGSVEDPKGAIAVFASSTSQSWLPPIVGQKKITQLLTQQVYNTIGSLFFHGSIAVLEDNSSSATQTFETWHIFGDASLQVRTQAPSEIHYTELSVLKGAEPSMELQVGEEGISAAVLQDDQLVGRGRSDKNGQILIPLSLQVDLTKKVELSLTGFNKIPLILELPL